MTTLSSISDVLEFLAKRNKFHARIMLGMAVIFAVSGVTLLHFAFSTQGTERVALLIGGGLFITMIMLPHSQMQSLRKQKIVMEMIVAVIDRIHDKATAERLSAILAETSETGQLPLQEILESVHRFDHTQRRGLMATSIALLATAGIAGVVLNAAYLEVTKSTDVAAVGRHEPDLGGSELERARGPMIQAEAEAYPVNKAREPLREPEPRAVTEAQPVKKEPAPAALEPPPDTEKLTQLQKQVSVLQQELLAAQEHLKQERLKLTVLQDETGTRRHDAEELQRRIEELERKLGEHEYLRLVNEALAYTYRGQPGDEERAETAYRRAVQIAQEKTIRDPAVFNAYGTFLQEHGRFEEAEKFYQMALEVNPGYGPALFNIGSLYEATGKADKALEKYKAAGETGEKLGTENYLRLRSTTNK